MSFADKTPVPPGLGQFHWRTRLVIGMEGDLTDKRATCLDSSGIAIGLDSDRPNTTADQGECRREAYCNRADGWAQPG